MKLRALLAGLALLLVAATATAGVWISSDKRVALVGSFPETTGLVSGVVDLARGRLLAVSDQGVQVECRSPSPRPKAQTLSQQTTWTNCARIEDGTTADFGAVFLPAGWSS